MAVTGMGIANRASGIDAAAGGNRSMSQTAKNPPPDTSLPTMEHERLDVFVGSWKTEGPSYAEGTSNESLQTSTVPMRTTESFEWLPGGYFLLHRWDGTVGDQPFQGLEILGYDAERGEYVSRFFDNNGNHPTYRVSERDGVWTYTGDRQRGRQKLHANGTAMKVHWDWSRDGKDWRPLCDLTSVKVPAASAVPDARAQGEILDRRPISHEQR
jgi:hypothetical protein